MSQFCEDGDIDQSQLPFFFQSECNLQDSILLKSRERVKYVSNFDAYEVNPQVFLQDESSDCEQRLKHESLSTYPTMPLSSVQIPTQDQKGKSQQIQKSTDSENELEASKQESLKVYSGTSEEIATIPTLKEKKINLFVRRKRDFFSFDIPRLLKSENKFYMYAEQLVDMEYLKRVAEGTEDEYFKEDIEVSIYSGLKFVNQVVHRIDNKCIETYSECADIYQNNISPLINFIDSLGDQHLHDTGRIILLFWEQFVEKYKKLIREQSEDPLFLYHQQSRYYAALEKFKELTTNIDQNKYIVYFLYKPNYENYQFDSYCVGYNSKMYELIGENAYNFISNVQKNGYFDPFSKRFRLKECLKRAQDFINNQINKDNNLKAEKYLPSEVKTMDKFIFPSFASSEKINLNSEYDTIHNLNFRVNEYLVFNEFLFEDSVHENIQQYRQKQFDHYYDVPQEQLNQLYYGQEGDEFFKKYYSDYIGELVQKGNKWLKRCGFVDIPKKKVFL